MKFNFNENQKLLFLTSAGLFIILSLGVAIFPAIWVQSHNQKLPGAVPLTKVEERGREIYISEGCVYCHTQQVRPLDLDKDFGRPSVPGDYADVKTIDFWKNSPSLLGTERTGPDLSNIGKRQPSDTWQFIHLYNPRALVPESIMPAFQWLFEIKKRPKSYETVVEVPEKFAPNEGKVVANDDAKALVAYLLALKQAALPGEMQVKEAHSQKETKTGKELFIQECASCHRADGQGVPGSFPPLKGDSLVTAKDPHRHVQVIINGLKGKVINGVDYKSEMPSFSILSDEAVARIADYERTSWGNKAPVVTDKSVASLRHGQTGLQGQMDMNTRHTGPDKKGKKLSGKNGEQLYQNSCASCHQTNGKGIPGTFPPLQGDPVVNAKDSKRHIEIVIKGLKDYVIGGKSYTVQMPSFASQLSDLEISLIVNHERTSWGNKAPVVTPEQVKAIRNEKPGRSQKSG